MRPASPLLLRSSPPRVEPVDRLTALRWHRLPGPRPPPRKQGCAPNCPPSKVRPRRPRVALRCRCPRRLSLPRRLAQRQISLESIVQRHESRSQQPGQKGKSGDPVPVILITYATSEDAVHKALAAVRRDRVISGRPQVIRIEKN